MAAEAPPPGYLRAFVMHDFGRRCRPDRFCFACPQAVCSHCCGQAHMAAHHPQANLRRNPLPQVRVLPGDCPAVSHDGVKGCGFSFDHVQRFAYGQDSFIPLCRRPAPPPEGKPLFCLRPECGDRAHHACETCSADCRLDVHHQEGSARGRANAAALIAANIQFLHEFEQDRYCTRCRSFFSSLLCGAHIGAHHTGLGAIIRIVREDGRVLTRLDAGVLPEHVLAGVQVMHVDGNAMVQIVPSDQPLDDDLIDGFNMCLANGCYTLVGDAYRACSLRCQLNEWVVLHP